MHGNKNVRAACQCFSSAAQVQINTRSCGVDRWQQKKVAYAARRKVWYTIYVRLLLSASVGSKKCRALRCTAWQAKRPLKRCRVVCLPRCHATMPTNANVTPPACSPACRHVQSRLPSRPLFCSASLNASKAPGKTRHVAAS